MKKDRIFLDKEYEGQFRFDENTASVFEDMLHRSVPLYSVMQELILSLTTRLSKPHTTIYDLGCSKGYLCRALKKAIADTSIQIVGIDNSEAMIDSAVSLMDSYPDSGIQFLCQDVLDCTFHNAGVVISCLTFQFIDSRKRAELIRRVYDNLADGGAMLVFEKTENGNEMLRNLEIDVYYELKAKNGYSQQEIQSKKRALEGVLVPFSDEQNVMLLKNAGFRHVSLILKWMNFSGYIAIK